MLLPAWSKVMSDDIAQLFSDIYKDDNGFRPDLSRWDRLSMEGYLDNRKDEVYYESRNRCCGASDDCSCCHYDWCINSDYYLDPDEVWPDDEDDHYTLMASEWQDGWA